MAVTPQTHIQLLETPLKEDQENQIDFDSLTSQNAYFEGLPHYELTDCTYQRKDNIIRAAGNVDSLRIYNYVRYQNKAFGNKWFYAFVTKMEYVNEYTTYIYIKTDVYQTWLFDFSLQTSFVEREHVDDDTIGLHTYPENLEYGNYIVNAYSDNIWGDAANSVLVMQVSDLPDTTDGSTKATYGELPNKIYNGMPSGCYYICFKTNAINGLNDWINAYNADGKQDAILAIFPLPLALADGDTGGSEILLKPLTNNISDNTFIEWSSGTAIQLGAIVLDKAAGSLDGYTPRNNKLYCNPYRYFYLNTFAGSTIEFNYEDFTGYPRFKIEGAITAGGEYKIYPTNLKNSTNAGYGYGMSLASYPQGSWNNSTYLNWRALNSDGLQIQTTASVARSAASGIGNLFSLNFGGAAVEGINAAESIAMALNQINIAKKLPDQARGDIASQTLAFSTDKIDGGWYHMSIRREYAEIIDKYFDMYGYKVNKVKQVFTRTRQNWNYVKTIGCNLTGRVPQDDLLEIKAIFDHGCTFWHNPANFLNYNLSNSII